MGFVYDLPAELAEKVLSLANMSARDAIRAALAEADRIDCSEAAVNAKTTNFYRLLSDSVVAGRITLKAIATDPSTNAWVSRTRGEPPHQTIPTDYFELPMVHNLFDNDLEADRFSTEAKMLDSIFNRIERENQRLLIKWSDVKIPPEQVGWLLSTFRNDGKVTGDRPLSTTSKPQLMRPAFEKIRAAIQAEEEATGKPFPTLRPVERNKRLADRMVAQGLKKQEIPNERTFRVYFNQGPGKPAKSS